MRQDVYVNDRHLEILERIEGRPLKTLLKTFNIPIPQSKSERRTKIIESLTDNPEPVAQRIPKAVFEQWIRRSYIPGNKNVFVYELDNDCVSKLKKFDVLENLISTNRVKERMGTLENTNQPIDPTLILLEVKDDGEGNEVDCIQLGFVQMGQLRELDEENDLIEWIPINYYVYAEIDLKNAQLTVWLEPTKKLHRLGNSKKGSFDDVAKEYKLLISAMFALSFQENSWISKVLYHMWQKDVWIEDPQITAKLNLCQKDIDGLIDTILPKLEIDLFDKHEVATRVNSLLKDLLIRQFGIELPERQGWVRRQRVFDGTAVVESFNDMPLYTASSHYGLQAIVDEVGEINKLEYVWRSPDEDEGEFITTITVMDEYYAINFWSYREEEEIRHVLSGIRENRRRISIPPGSSNEV